GAAVGFAGSDDGQPPAWMQSPGNPVLLALATGRPILVHDAADPASPAGWPVDACSGVIVPLQDRDRLMGALVALATTPRRFAHDELQLLQTVGNLLAALVQRRRTEEQLAHAQRLEALGQLTGGIAHDFNNLLTVVSGSLQMLEDEYAAHPGARQLIESALRSVGRGAELTTKLLAFARRQHLRPRPVCPSQTLVDLTMMLRSTLGDAIRIDQECEDGLPPVLADPSQLEAALLNLALNARDAMPDGGRIRIGARERWMTLDATRPERKPGHYVAFSVTDNGQGMSAAVQARALEPFFS